MTDYLLPGRAYEDCYRSLCEIVATYEGGLVDYDIDAIERDAIVPHPSGEGWMIVGADDPIDNGDALWRVIWGNAYPDDDIQALARVIAAAGDAVPGGTHPRTAARDWLDWRPNITPDELRDWLAAGVWLPRVAVMLRLAGVDPEDIGPADGAAMSAGDLMVSTYLVRHS